MVFKVDGWDSPDSGEQKEHLQLNLIRYKVDMELHHTLQPTEDQK